MVCSSVLLIGRVSCGARSISLSIPLERSVDFCGSDLSTIRQQKPPRERRTVKNRPVQRLPYSELVPPTPSSCSQFRIRLHVPVPASTHHHEVVRCVEELGSTHSTIDSVMRDELILTAAMPASAIPLLHELQNLLRHSHKPSLYL